MTMTTSTSAWRIIKGGVRRAVRSKTTIRRDFFSNVQSLLASERRCFVDSELTEIDPALVGTKVEDEITELTVDQ